MFQYYSVKYPNENGYEMMHSIGILVECPNSLILQQTQDLSDLSC